MECIHPFDPTEDRKCVGHIEVSETIVRTGNTGGIRNIRETIKGVNCGERGLKSCVEMFQSKRHRLGAKCFRRNDMTIECIGFGSSTSRFILVGEFTIQCNAAKRALSADAKGIVIPRADILKVHDISITAEGHAFDSGVGRIE